MKFKTPEIKEQFYSGKLDFRLWFILFALDSYTQNVHNYEIMITSIYRPHLVDSGIHNEWRAADVRIRDMQPNVKSGVIWFLSHIIYSGPKKSILEHNVVPGLPADHLHLQVDNDGVLEINNQKIGLEK